MELTGTNRPTQHTNTRERARESEHQRTRERASGTREHATDHPHGGGRPLYGPRPTPTTHAGPHHTGAHPRTRDTRTEHGARTHDTTTRVGGRGTRPDQARPGGHSGGATPGPIPNPEAKTPSADGTAPARVRKSRTPPGHHNTTTQEVPRSERVHMTRTCSRQVPHCIVFSLTRGGAVR